MGRPRDKHEQEADRVADMVMRMPEPRLQRQAVPGEYEEQELHEVLRSPGRPLDPATRAFMEPRFGHDFSQVRVHTGPQAARIAESLNARAFTLGQKVVFGAGQYDSQRREGQRLLAHELTHVLQQGGGEVKRETPATPVNKAPAFIQRVVSYAGSTICRDIDFFDPTTAPAGRTTVAGITEMVVNGTTVKWSSQDDFDLLFPLPTYTKSYTKWGGECTKSGSTISLHVTSDIRVLKNPPWNSTVSHGDLANIFGGRLAKEPGCSGGNVNITFTGTPRDTDTGTPRDTEFQQWLIDAEMQHAHDQECLVDKYLKGYENDVNALPSTIPSGYYWFGDCNARLDEQLKRPERWNTMVKEREDWVSALDAPASPGRRGGPHKPTFNITTDTGCANIIVTLSSQILGPPRGPCKPWSPP